MTDSAPGHAAPDDTGREEAVEPVPPVEVAAAAAEPPVPAAPDEATAASPAEQPSDASEPPAVEAAGRAEYDEPSEAVPSEAVPSEAVPSEAVPSEAVPSEPVPSEVVSPEPAVTEAVSSEPAASEAVSSEPAPSEAVPSEPVPSEPVAAAEAAAVSAAPGLTYATGDIVPGTVTNVSGDGIEVDLGGGQTGVIPRSEVVGAEPAVGDSIEGQVIRRQSGSGRYVLSPRRAAKERAWTRVRAAFEAGELVRGTVTGTTKGGLVVDLGVRGFLPESLIDVRRPTDLQQYVGQEIEAKVIECERQGERVVLNRKSIAEKQRAASRGKLLAELQPGERRTGVVTSIVPFGAFVDLGGAEGLIHISELAHRTVATPNDVVHVGETVEVVVLDVKSDKGKISLSRKAALPDPWEQLVQQHKVNDLVYGTVTALAPFGAFISLSGEGYEGVEGLVHISELSRYRVESPSEVVAIGEGVWVKVLGIDPAKRRLSLSLRRALE